MNTTSPKRRPPQMTLGFMMLMMVVFAIVSAGILYASRVPAVQEELDLLLKGSRASSGAADGASRFPHIVFIMFTLTSPLLLAGVLSTGVTLWRWLERRP